MTSPFDTVFGLPTHVLIVHATVVLLPMAAVGAIAIVLRRPWIHRLGLTVAIVAIVGASAAWVSRFSGGHLASRVGYPEPHVQYGQTLPIIATVFAGFVVAYWLLARGVPGNRSRPWWLLVVAGAVIVGAVGVTVATVVTGHSGSQAVWSSIIENTRPGQIPAQ